MTFFNLSFGILEVVAACVSFSPHQINLVLFMRYPRLCSAEEILATVVFDNSLTVTDVL